MISNFNAKEHKTEFVLYVNKYYYKKQENQKPKGYKQGRFYEIGGSVLFLKQALFFLCN